jgi:PTS system galactitol-specific IIA component
MFNSDLINLSANVANSEELFEFIGKDAQKKGYANTGYVDGLKIRENKYPTGLIFPTLNLALPHVDPEYVNKPFIYVVRTTQSIDWRQMGDTKPMTSNNFLFLGIKEPSKQVGLLAQIIAAFQDTNFVTQFLASKTQDMMLALLQEKFSKTPA